MTLFYAAFAALLGFIILFIKLFNKPELNSTMANDPTSNNSEQVEEADSEADDEEIEDTFPDVVADTEGFSQVFDFGGYPSDEKGLAVIPSGSPQKIAMVFGINVCSKEVYGDKLKLRGCVNDAEDVRKMLVGAGFGQIYTFYDKTATISNFLKTWKTVRETIKEGDTLFISMSRHGMSMLRNHLEQDTEIRAENEDGNIYSGDQAAVMHDGVIVDDCFWRLFSDLPKVKIIYWNDSCHSATQYKVALSPKGKWKATAPIPRSVGPEYMPAKDRVLDLVQLNTLFPKTTKKPDFTLVSLAGCQDHEYSADAYINKKYHGAFTFCALEHLSKNPKATFLELSEAVKKGLKARRFSQNPQFNVVANGVEVSANDAAYNEIMGQPIFPLK